MVAAVAGGAASLGLDAPSAVAAEEAPVLPPKKRARLHNWLRTFRYRETYAPEPRVHPSAGPHGGNVRTWFSPSLVEDLRAEKRNFRKGAVLVKELYGNSRTQLEGWAVMYKTRASRRPKSAGAWIWYETFRLDGRSGVFGRGKPGCASCHGKGPDFLRSTYRP